MRDVDHHAFGVFARVQDLQAVWVVDAGFRRPGPTAAARCR